MERDWWIPQLYYLQHAYMRPYRRRHFRINSTWKLFRSVFSMVGVCVCVCAFSWPSFECLCACRRSVYITQSHRLLYDACELCDNSNLISREMHFINIFPSARPLPLPHIHSVWFVMCCIRMLMLILFPPSHSTHERHACNHYDFIEVHFLPAHKYQIVWARVFIRVSRLPHSINSLLSARAHSHFKWSAERNSFVFLPLVCYCLSAIRLGSSWVFCCCFVLPSAFAFCTNEIIIILLRNLVFANRLAYKSSRHEMVI